MKALVLAALIALGAVPALAIVAGEQLDDPPILGGDCANVLAATGPRPGASAPHALALGVEESRRALSC